MSITRSEGYRQSQGKEEPAILLAQQFLHEVAAVLTDRIENADENYEHGDLRVQPSGATIEVKGQPIDPKRYPQNFVEVFEDTTTRRLPHHAGGLARVATILGLDEAFLQERPVIRYDRDSSGGEKAALGALPFASVSINSMAGSAATIYVNVQSKVLYVYRSAEVLDLVRAAVQREPLRRGMGRSNRDTHAVLVGLPALRWKFGNDAWRFEGVGNPAAAPVALRGILGL